MMASNTFTDVRDVEEEMLDARDGNTLLVIMFDNTDITWGGRWLKFNDRAIRAIDIATSAGGWVKEDEGRDCVACADCADCADMGWDDVVDVVDSIIQDY